MHDLKFQSVEGLLDGYRKRDFSPSEVVSQFLAAVKQEEFNSFLEVCTDLAKEQAQKLDRDISNASKYPLFGVPVAVKDNFLVRGSGASAASQILKGYRSPYTSTAVERLEAAGAIVIGKTNLDEFAMGSSNENSSFGPVKNPWDLDRVPGGSSGGSAAAVAAGLAPLSLGTDTGGSIRQPASLCGVVGVKPTYGRVSRYGVIAFASSLDQVGPFGRSVWDAARALEVMAGYDGRDATTSRAVVPPYTESLSQFSLQGFKVGVPRKFLDGCDPEVLASYEGALAVMQKEGAKLVDIELPHAKYAVSVYYLIAPSEASSNLARYDGIHYGFRDDQDETHGVYSASRGHGFGAEVKLRIMLGTYALSSGYYDAYYLKANQVRKLIEQDFLDAYSKCDLIATPTSPTTAFRLGEKVDDPLQMYLSDVFTVPANLAGVPGVSIPCGLDSHGLPIGIQFLGKHFEELALFQACRAYEKARGGFPHPKGGR